MSKILYCLTGALGVLAIAVGAVAAHSGLTETEAAWVTTGVRYHLPHVMVMFAALVGVKALSETWRKTKICLLRATLLWALGIVGFCCGLYAQAFWSVDMGVIVPIGAVLMMFGWVVAAVALIRGQEGR